MYSISLAVGDSDQEGQLLAQQDLLENITDKLKEFIIKKSYNQLYISRLYYDV